MTVEVGIAKIGSVFEQGFYVNGQSAHVAIFVKIARFYSHGEPATRELLPVLLRLR